ncbi:hypothetical protein [Luteibacter aegosomatissinici]|uniref:hypothetical protein n=1 Tax=Luteibacter aegosomatissinici TaxID=2911539 RepID=UPI001FF90020|nr:hypothetical protein [Luteibacter aegosomatissinici]UPG94749.1 hypothetical protein L2Y97_01190 [Luteibacter aegosomatissinici]
MSSVVKAWFAITAIGIGTLVCFLRQGPPDEEMMFRGFEGQVLLATMMVGIPSMAGLLMFMLFGALAKRYLLR